MSEQMSVEWALSMVRGDLEVASYLLDMMATGDPGEIFGRKLDTTEASLMLARVLRADADELSKAHHIMEMLPPGTWKDADEAL